VVDKDKGKNVVIDDPRMIDENRQILFREVIAYKTADRKETLKITITTKNTEDNYDQIFDQNPLSNVHRMVRGLNGSDPTWRVRLPTMDGPWMTRDTSNLGPSDSDFRDRYIKAKYIQDI
jgi:hypothetical protein